MLLWENSGRQPVWWTDFQKLLIQEFKLITDGQTRIAGLHVYEVSRILRFIEDRREECWPGAEGSQCFVGTELQFRKMRRFWRGMVGMAAQRCECDSGPCTVRVQMVKIGAPGGLSRLIV